MISPFVDFKPIWRLGQMAILFSSNLYGKPSHSQNYIILQKPLSSFHRRTRGQWAVGSESDMVRHYEKQPQQQENKRSKPNADCIHFQTAVLGFKIRDKILDSDESDRQINQVVGPVGLTGSQISSIAL